jgi:putative SOS response-associated peptidase YedK
MCGRFTPTSPRQVIEQTFDVDLGSLDATAAPRFNIAPSQDVLAVAIGKEGDRKAIPMRWGLIPSWSNRRFERDSFVRYTLSS